MKKWYIVQNKNRAKDIEISENVRNQAIGKLIDGRIDSQTP